MTIEELNDIKIENWQKFLSDNDEIMKSLNYWTSDVCDITANVSAIISQVESLNDSLSSISTLEEIPTLPKPDDLKSIVDAYSNILSEKVYDIGVTIRYSEQVIEAYNNGESVSNSLTEEYVSLINGENKQENYWILGATFNNEYNGVDFLLRYSSYTDYGDNIDDIAQSMFWQNAYKPLRTLGVKAFAPLIENNSRIWVNAEIGAVITVGWEALHNIIERDGRIDARYFSANVGAAALKYVSWTLINGYVAQAVGGSLGGPVGFAVASVLSKPINAIIDSIASRIKQTNIIDRFTINGVEYEVPLNGTGEYGTYEFLLKEQLHAFDDYHTYQVNGVNYTEPQYKGILYTNWRDVVGNESWIDLNDPLYSEGAAILDSILERISSPTVTSWEEANRIIQEMTSSSYVGTGWDTIADYMTDGYDFSFEEFYYFHHPQTGDVSSGGSSSSLNTNLMMEQ